MNHLFRNLMIAVVAAVLLVPAGTAQASDTQFSIMMDDDLMLYRGDDVRDAALTRMQSMDVDVVRVTVLWSVVANEARETRALDRRFRRLGADDPRAYPMLNWDRYDRLVKAARRLGMRVLFNVTGPGPAYGHATAPRAQRASRATWRPKPREFYKFVQAVGKRFSGTYRDENDERGADNRRLLLPKVEFWSIWNEPNQAGWLTPQTVNGRPASPHIYRELYDFGYRALVSTGHGSDTILGFETAPLGSSRPPSVRQPIDPTTFVREFFCVDANNQPSTANPLCRGAKFPVRMSAFAHHPYTKNQSPLQTDPDPNAITIANLPALTGMLDSIAANTGRVAGGMNIVSTEFSYETNPPDPFSGISPELQSNWSTLAEFVAFNNPRVLGHTQFLLRDVKPRARNRRGSKAFWSTFQSGLYDQSDRPKPALTSYIMPFLAQPGAVDPASGRPVVNLWGSLRFRPDGLPPGTDFAEIQWKPPGAPEAAFVRLDAIPVTNIKNYYTGAVIPPGPGSIRAVWRGGVPPFVRVSREIAVP